jgi:membrane protein DedA with SNARE-associated domain
MAEPAVPAEVQGPLPPPLGQPVSTPPPHPLPRAAVRRLVLVAGLLLYVAGTIGSNIAPAVIDDHPVGVLALSSRNRNLFASVPYIEPAAYAVVGFFRVLAAAVVLYLIGRWYGAKGIGWVEGQVGELPATIRWIQRGVDRAGRPLVVLMPGSNIVCLMVGHRRMAPRTFLPLVTVGIVLKLIVLWAGGKIFEDQIKAFLDFIERYQWWVVIGLFVLTFVQSAGRVRKSVPEVIEEIEHPAEPPVAPPDPARYGAGMDGGPDTK